MNTLFASLERDDSQVHNAAFMSDVDNLIFVAQCDRNVCYYSFSRRVVNSWNYLPPETVDIPHSTLTKCCFL